VRLARRAGNPEPSWPCTARRCRDYLRASALLITGIEHPAP
jgi:hypothetical protein